MLLAIIVVRTSILQILDMRSSPLSMSNLNLSLLLIVLFLFICCAIAILIKERGIFLILYVVELLLYFSISTILAYPIHKVFE